MTTRAYIPQHDQSAHAEHATNLCERSQRAHSRTQSVRTQNEAVEWAACLPPECWAPASSGLILANRRRLNQRSKGIGYLYTYFTVGSILILL